ncbi:hypothetical protein GQ42DRAFT_179089 [Ramicandelaber brevisporus]|nr:hypothetical protein GQ42DRAFT_179089 [Ramicandelaber brevisporus]
MTSKPIADLDVFTAKVDVAITSARSLVSSWLQPGGPDGVGAKFLSHAEANKSTSAPLFALPGGVTASNDSAVLSKEEMKLRRTILGKHGAQSASTLSARQTHAVTADVTMTERASWLSLVQRGRHNSDRTLSMCQRDIKSNFHNRYDSTSKASPHQT